MTKLNMNILADFEAAQIKRELPAFGPGDTVV
ncbi:MAG: 50S ribosomal protein L19, partial [Lysobacteraceae bacterium]